MGVLVLPPSGIDIPAEREKRHMFTGGDTRPMPTAAAKQAAKSKDHPASGRAEPADPVSVVGRACRYLDARMEGDGDTVVTLAELGRHCAMSPWHLQRLFKRTLGVTPRQYADARRLDRFRAGLQQGNGVASATYDAGFGSSSRVYERAGPALGMTPATYAKGGRGTVIAYATAQCPLGRLLVAETPRGVCFVALGERDGPLVEKLRREYPAAAAIMRDDQALGQAVRAILDMIDGAEPHADLPLDIRFTAFQRRVWEELSRIPAGETRSYSEIAAALGNPAAQRAVGRACATNPVPVLIPCHRAIRQDGELGGYRWGPNRKRKLLAREGQSGGAEND
jgi:AraC family transcriptional regulator of adaptative response/methylated-DNA-[protein]-cysteine methyltransferase